MSIPCQYTWFSDQDLQVHELGKQESVPSFFWVSDLKRPLTNIWDSVQAARYIHINHWNWKVRKPKSCSDWKRNMLSSLLVFIWTLPATMPTPLPTRRLILFELSSWQDVLWVVSCLTAVPCMCCVFMSTILTYHMIVAFYGEYVELSHLYWLAS